MLETITDVTRANMLKTLALKLNQLSSHMQLIYIFGVRIEVVCYHCTWISINTRNTMTNKKRITPTMCMHQIFLEYNV